MTLDARSRRRRRWFLIAAAFVAAGLGAAWWITPSERERVDVEIAALREAGFATTFEELDGPALAPEENGAAEFLAAMELVTSRVGERSTWTAPGPWSLDLADDWQDRLTPEQSAAIEEFVVRLGPAFERLDAAVARPRLRFAPPTSLDTLSRGFKPLQLAAMILEDRGIGAPSPADRIEAAVTQLRLARRVECHVLIEHMIAAANARGAASRVRRSIERGLAPATSVRARLEPELRWTAWPRIDPAIRGEIVWTAGLMRRHVRDGVPLPDLLEPAPWYAAAWERFASGSVVEALPALGRIARLDVRSPAVFVAACDDELERAPRAAETVLLVWPMVARKLVETDAQLALCRVGLALAERHQTSGRWPATLDDVRDAFAGESVPQDPFTGAPFVYEMAEERVRLRSAGKFPGGAELDLERLREDGLLWELPR